MGTYAAAKAWFLAKRLEMLTRRFGRMPKLAWHDMHVTVDNVSHETRVDGLAVFDDASG